MNIKKRLFPNTALALKEFDKGQPARDKAWSTAESNDDVAKAGEADLVALDKVQSAYHLDTMDINSKSACKQVPVAFMRRMVAE